MVNRKLRWVLGTALFSLAVAVGLSGCDSVNSQEMAEQNADKVIKPVKLIKMPDLNQQQVNSFIAKLDATERAVLSFNVSGEIASAMPHMGQQIKKGELLASLDPTDYQLALDARQAEYDLARTQYLRAKALIKETLISKDQFDQNETNYKVAKALLEQAKTDLTYTKMRAPFDGVVSLTSAEAHQVVAANQPVMKVLNNALMDVVFTVPVSYVSQYGVEDISRSAVWVTMDFARDRKLEAHFKEISTQPNIDTNSYTARVTVRRPDDLTLLTGMSGQVNIIAPDQTSLFTLPKSAWISREAGSGYVWKYSASQGVVHKTLVGLDENGFIQSGLQQGDLVVETGINGLNEAQKVKPWVEEDGI